MATIRETDLPGIGRKFLVETNQKEKIIIILHDDGKREVFHISPDDPDENISVMTLDDLEARQLAGIIGGMSYSPTALETAEIELDKLSIEWYKIKNGARCIGKTIGELGIRENTGTTVIAAIEKDRKQTINPGPDYILQADITLVVAGERKSIRSLKHMLEGSDI